MAQHQQGRIVLGVISCGTAVGIYALLRRRRLRRPKTAAIELVVGLDRLRFDLSNHGFVPDESDVVKKLPASYDSWEDTAAKLPELTKSHEIRAVVDKWPQLNLDQFINGVTHIKPIRRANAILSMISQCYIWCDEENPRTSLPVALAVPLHQSASALGIPPIVTHAAVDLWNFERKPGCDFKLRQENFQCITTMTGTSDEAWFYLSSTVVQSLAGPALLGAYDLYAEHLPGQDTKSVEDWLDTTAQALEDMSATLSRLPEGCTPNVFWKVMRPFLQGAGGESSLLPDGIIFEGVGDAKPIRLCGASAAQSTAIPVLDAIFGIKHRYSLIAFLKEMRDYMPRPHREYLELMRAQEPLNEWILRWQSQGVPVDSLIMKFNVCLDKLAAFRKEHWSLVGSHIIAMKQADIAELARACPVGGGAKRGLAKDASTGTAGSPLEDFLVGTIKATLATKIV